MKILLFLALLGTMPLACQSISTNETKFYAIYEIDIYLNDYNVLTPYNESAYIQKVGVGHTKFVDTNPSLKAEFGHNIYEYYYGDSFVTINDEYGVCGIVIKNPVLSINGITIGDTRSKVLEAFSKVNIEANNLFIYHGDNSLTFTLDANNKVSEILFYVPD